MSCRYSSPKPSSHHRRGEQRAIQIRPSNELSETLMYQMLAHVPCPCTRARATCARIPVGKRKADRRIDVSVCQHSSAASSIHNVKLPRRRNPLRRPASSAPLERHLRDVVTAIGVVFVRHRDNQNQRGEGHPIIPRPAMCTNAESRAKITTTNRQCCVRITDLVCHRA